MKANLLTFVRGLKNGTPPRFQSYLKSLTLLLGLALSSNVWGENYTGSLEITISNFTEITASYTTKFTHEYTINKSATETQKCTIEAYGVYKNSNGIQMNSGKGTYIKNTSAFPGYITSIECTWTATGKNTPTLYVNKGSVASTSSTKLGKGSNTITTQTYTVTNASTSECNYFYFDGTTVTGACYLSKLKINYSVGTADPVTTLYLSEAGSLSDNLKGTHKVGDKYTLPPKTDATCGDKTFVGWSTETVDSPTKPTSKFYEPGEEVTLAANNTFYAVFADASEGGGEQGSVVVSYSSTNFPTGYGTANTFTEYTLEGYKFKIQQVYKNGEKQQWRAGGNSSGTGIIYNNEAFPGKIASVVVTWDNSDGNKNHTLKKGSSANPTEGTSVNGVYNSTEGTTTFDCGGDCDYFVLTNGSGAGYTKSFTINYGGGTTYSDYTTTCGAATDPKINANNVDLAYDATSGEIAYTIDNPVEGKTLVASEDADWISDVAVNAAEGKVTFTATANTGHVSRSATITLNYGEGLATKSVTVTQAAAPYSTIADLFNDAPATAADVNIAFGNWVISGIGTDNKSVYVTDNAGKGFVIYGSNHGFAVGDVLSGTATCKFQLYTDGFLELTNLTSSTSGLTVTKNGTVTPQTIAIADLGGVNTGAVITFSNILYNGTNFTDGTNVIKPYNKLLSSLPSLTSDKKYNVTGVYIHYKSGNPAKEIAPRTSNDIQLVTYDITINIVGNGTVTSSPANKACEGDEVALTINPTPGYRLSSLSVTDADGNPVEVTENKFTMPAKAVTVSAVFAEIQKRDVTLHIGNGTTVISQVLDGTPFSEIKPATDPAGDAAGDCANAFVGWATEAITGSTTEDKVAWVTASTIVAEGSTDFYAVFANKSGDSQTKVLDFEAATNTEWTYANVTRTEATTSNAANGGSYYGLFNSNVNIQFNQKVNVTKFSYYCVRRTNNTNTSIKIQTSTNGSTWVDAETTSTAWSYFNSDGKTYKQVSLDFDGETAYYVRLSITTGAYRQVDDISISYGNVTYSDYVTSCCTKHDVKLTNNGVATGGSFEANPAKACDGTDITLIATPETGYQFVAWSTNPTQTIVDNVFTMPDEDVTVSASFELQKHNVTLHKNDGVNPEATDVTEYTYGDTKNLKTLATLAWSVDGHIFAGWATSAAGKGEYEDGYAFKLEEENDVDLYATWVEESLRPVTYTSVEHLTYANTNPETVNKDATGFVVAYTVDAHYQVTDAAVTVNGVALTSGITVGQSGLTIEKTDGFDGPIVVTPVVAPIIYNVIWKANGEQFATNTVQQGSKPTVPATEPTTCGDAIKFMGWTNNIVADQADAPDVLFKDAADAPTVETATENTVTFYAVYAEEGGTGEMVDKLITSVEYDTWTRSGTTTNMTPSGKAAYRLFGENAYVETESFDLSKITKVVVYGGTYGGTSYGDLAINGVVGGTTTTWKNTAVSGDSQTGKNEFTVTSNPLSGTGKLRVMAKKGNGSNNGLRLTKVEVYTQVPDIGYSHYSTTCVPALEAPNFTTDEGEYCTSVDVAIAKGDNPEEAKLQYSLDGGTSWTDYSALTLTETKTVKARVILGPKTSDEAEATYIILKHYSDLTALKATASADEVKKACVSFSNLLVNATNVNTVYLTDGTNAYMIYKNTHGFSRGQKLSTGEHAILPYKLFNGVLQFNDNAGITVSSSDNATPATTMAVDAIAASNYGQLVKIENVIYVADGAYFKDGSDNKIKLGNNIVNASSWVKDGAKYDITGIITTQMIEEVPTLTISPRVKDLDVVSKADKLNAPSNLTVSDITGSSAKLSWTKSSEEEGAVAKYNIVIMKGNEVVRDFNTTDGTKDSYGPTGLEAGTTYTWKIRAIGNDLTTSTSDWADAADPFQTLQAAKLVWMVNGVKVDETTAVNEKVVMTTVVPTSDCSENYQDFICWVLNPIEGVRTEKIYDNMRVSTSTSAKSNTDGTLATYTFYAAFGKVETEGSDVYTLVTEAPDSWAGDYLIAQSESKFANGYYSGTNGIGKEGNYVNLSESIVDNTIAGEIGNPYHVTFETCDGGYLMKSQSGYYNYKSSNNSNGIDSTQSVNTADDYPITISLNDGGTVHMSLTNGAKFQYNNDGSGYFRFYKSTSSQSDCYLYKRTLTPKTYSAYITTCPTFYTITLAGEAGVKDEGIITASKTTEVEKNTVITLSVEAKAGYTATGGTWKITKTSVTPEVDVTADVFNAKKSELIMPDYDVTVDYNFQEKKDQFVDNLHGNTTIEKGGANYELPVLADFSETTGKPSDAFTKFIGWSATSYDSGEPATEQPTILEGSQTATGATYVAVWYNGSGKYITEYCQTSAPANLHLVAEYHKATSVRIDWNNVTGADMYHIIVMDGGANIIANADVTESLYDLSGLTPGATYICTVKAHKNCWSDETGLEFETKENIQSYAVTINAEGGTYTIDPALDEDGKIQEGATVMITNIAPTDADHYFFKELTVPEATDLIEIEGSYMFTMPSKAITINIVFAEYPTVTWKMEGAADVVTTAVLKEDKFKVGTVKSAPANWKYKTYFPEFAGWVTADKCDAEGNVTTAEFITAATEVPATGLTIYGAVAKSSAPDCSTATKITSNENLDMSALYVIGAEYDKTTLYYKGIDGTWGKMTSDVAQDAPMAITLSGSASALALIQSDGKYIEPCTGNSFAVSDEQKLVVMNENGDLTYNNTRLLTYNHNSGSGGIRWYASTSSNPKAYLYQVPLAYENLTINPQPDYGRTDLVAGNYGTVCVPYAVKVADRSGATFWNIETSNAPGSTNPTSVTIVEETGNLVAGKPYIFFATDTKMALFFSDDKYEGTESVEANGLFGNLTDGTITINQTEYVPGYFFVLQQKLYECGWNCTVGPNRGWVQATAIENMTTPSPAPRRVIGNPNGTPTGIHNLNADGFKNIEGARKYFHNNNIVIVNEGRIYNAQGILIQ